jgi:hypothetical protein
MPSRRHSKQHDHRTQRGSLDQHHIQAPRLGSRKPCQHAAPCHPGQDEWRRNQPPHANPNQQRVRSTNRRNRQQPDGSRRGQANKKQHLRITDIQRLRFPRDQYQKKRRHHEKAEDEHAEDHVPAGPHPAVLVRVRRMPSVLHIPPRNQKRRRKHHRRVTRRWDGSSNL